VVVTGSNPVVPTNSICIEALAFIARRILNLA
jgi:hypothetical protein